MNYKNKFVDDDKKKGNDTIVKKKKEIVRSKWDKLEQKYVVYSNHWYITNNEKYWKLVKP